MHDIFKAHELKEGDIVRLFNGAFGDAIVEQIKDGSIHFARPYIARPDFTYTGGVIVLTGVEHFTAPVESAKTYILLERPRMYAEEALKRA
jgi:hypothetical protein